MRYSYTEDVVGMQTILLRNLSVPELVIQVCNNHYYDVIEVQYNGALIMVWMFQLTVFDLTVI